MAGLGTIPAAALSLRMHRSRRFDQRAKGGWGKKAPAATPASQAAASGTPASVADPFKQALDTLSGASGDIEKNYQAGKRRTMSNIAMQSVNAGMANTLNMPAAELAYENEVRPGMNIGLAQAKAGVLQNLGQTAANVYGTQVGSSTSLQTAQMGADVTSQGQGLAFASNQANQALNKYIARLKYGSGGGQSNNSPVPTLRRPSV